MFENIHKGLRCAKSTLMFLSKYLSGNHSYFQVTGSANVEMFVFELNKFRSII